MRHVSFTLLVIGLSFPVWGQQHKPRIAVGGLSAESNSLYPRAQLMREGPPVTDREAWMAEALKANSVFSGVVEASRKVGLDLYPVVRAGAGFLGYVDKASFDQALNKLVNQLKTANPPFDGVILIDHGAMAVDGYPHGDAEVARRVREAMGPKFPIIMTNDFHANVCEDLVRYTDVLITYKENPHLDTKQRGIQAATIMAGMLSGKMKPVQALVKPPMIVNLVYQDTFHEPFKHITDESRRLERENPKILVASVPGGYQWADVPAIGPSAVVVTNNDPELAQREAKRLSDMIWAIRDKLVFKSPDPAKAVRDAMAADKFPVVLMDTGDNIGGGSAGDGTFILAELVKQKAEGWVVVISDAAANKAAFAAGIDGAFDQMVGGKTDKMHGDPVRIKGRVKSMTDGNYVETEIRHGGGRYGSMGQVSVIGVEGSTKDLSNLLVLTNRPTSPNSLHQLVSHGIYPQGQKILVAKGTTAPRAAYEPIAAKIVEVNSGGATDVNPKRFTYKYVRPGLFGLDK